ncbi:hypothetical protein [Brevibacterium linens]|uniref:hypothetical protein n=1 Tax=Brevibacterium linens TaxID=1703 RepID=UPI003BF577AC
MFSESWPWKRDLGAAADRLGAARFGLSTKLRLGEEDEADAWETGTEAVYEVERDAMTAAFAIRRLIGMPSKVTKSARGTMVNVFRFDLTEGSKVPDIWDALGSIDMYNLGSPKSATISANEMCNLFVHSFFFGFAWTLDYLPWFEYWLLPENDARCDQEPTELAGFLLTTDKSRGEYLSFVSIEELIRVSRVFANDNAVSVQFYRDKRGRMHATAFGPDELPASGD